jgi:lysophospholipase L1-like esterase
VTSVVSFATAESAPGLATTNAVTGPARLEGEVRKYEVVDRRTPPPAHPVLFTGSSSLRLWTNLVADFPGHAVLNRGFGGSQMRDLLHFFDRLVGRYQPSVVVVYEGDNDLASGQSVEEVYAQYLQFLQRVRNELPGTPVVILAVKPSPSRLKWMAGQRDLNARLEALAGSGPGLVFVDTFHPLLDAAGVPRPECFRADHLHLTPAGYAAWKPVVEAGLIASLQRPAGRP